MMPGGRPISVRSENARLQMHDTLTRNLSERYFENSSSSSSSSSTSQPEIRELQDFDNLVNLVLEQCAEDTRFADPAICRRFVEQRLHLELLELQDKLEDEAERHIEPFNEQEELRKQYCLSEERRKDAEDAENARWRQWCEENPQKPPPRHVSAVQNEVDRQQKRLERLERKLTQSYLEEERAAQAAARNARLAAEPPVRRIEAPWKINREASSGFKTGSGPAAAAAESERQLRHSHRTASAATPRSASRTRRSVRFELGVPEGRGAART
jgi:hypothetical protein